MWTVSGKKGNSSFDKWKFVLKPVIEALQQMDWLSEKSIHIVADREFASPKLAEWIKTSYKNVDATLRIKSSMYLKSEEMPEIKVASLIQKMVRGSRYIMSNQIITRNSTFQMNVLLTWKKDYNEPLIVATTSGNPDRADKVYALRFGIEPMHKDWKTNAFDLEKTRVTDPKRIETLLIAIAFAYILSVIEGEHKDENGEVRKPPKGKSRMTGLFLDGIRTISKFLKRTGFKEFKSFLRDLLLPFFKAWKVNPSNILNI